MQIWICPVKTVTWILMKTLCHFMLWIDDSLVQIDTEFHNSSMSFIQVLLVFHAQTWHGFWTSSSHRTSAILVKKMMGFSLDLVSFSTKPQSKRHEKIPVTFFKGHCMYILHCPTNYKLISPLKNVTGFVMKIPWHFTSQIGGNLAKINTKFHDYSMSFIQLLFVYHGETWHGFWTEFESWNFHGIC